MACHLLGAGHYMNQCWNIVNWTLGNQLQWNFNQNLYIFISEDANWQPSCLSLNVSKLECIWSTRYVNCTPTSEVTPVTFRHIHPPHHGDTGHIMVANGWLAFFLFHVNRSYHSWDKAVSDSDLKTQRSRSSVWYKTKFGSQNFGYQNWLPLGISYQIGSQH